MLRLEEIWTYYGRIAALQGVSCEVREGEIVVLIGANGAGKSTVLNTVSGITPASKGAVRFQDQDITNLSPHSIVGLGISQVPEGRRIFPQMSVHENLLMGAYLRPKGEPDERERVFELFPRLKERLRQAAGTLSGGEQQMLAIGRALMARPKLLLLDEPSIGLAPILVEEVFRALSEVKKMGITILLVEQNAKMALQLADRGYVLETGKVVVEGPADDLIHDAKVAAAYLGI